MGIFNYVLILGLRIPPIIATLSSSFVILSAAIADGRGLRIKPPSLLAEFTTVQVFGVPVLAICVIVLAALMGGGAPPHDLRSFGHRHRPEHARRLLSPASQSSASAS